MNEASPELQTRIVLRPIGVPLPLGLSALAVGSLLVAVQEFGWLGSDASFEVGLVLVSLVGPLQLFSAVIGFLIRDPIAGTGIALSGSGWLLLGLDRILASAQGDALGLALIAIGAALSISVAVAALSKLVVAAVLAMTALRFALSGAFAISGSAVVEQLAGGLGLLLAPLALYTALAAELEAVGRPVLPLGRHGAGRIGISGSPAQQVEGIENEAGVRRQG